MSKAYILTVVDYGETCDGKARTLGVYFDRKEAQRTLDADIDDYKAMHPTYTESELAVTDEDGNGREWNIEEKDIIIPLTPLQVSNLNGIAESIATNENDSYFSYIDSLSDEEDEYLLDGLARRGIAIDKENELEMRGEEAREWLANHGEVYTRPITTPKED